MTEQWKWTTKTCMTMKLAWSTEAWLLGPRTADRSMVNCPWTIYEFGVAVAGRLGRGKRSRKGSCRSGTCFQDRRLPWWNFSGVGDEVRRARSAGYRLAARGNQRCLEGS